MRDLRSPGVEVSLFSLSGMLIVFYLWVFEGFLQFNVCWTEIYGSKEDLLREDYIKFLSYPSKWFCLFSESLAFMQCAVFICGLIFDMYIIHVVTGIQVLSVISVSKRTLERMRNIILNSLVLCILVHVGHTPRLFCISFLNDSWCTSKIELSIEWYFSSSKDAFHSHLSCLPHQHKRPYIQAISFLPFTSPQTLVQDQKHNRRQFLCSNYFLVSEMITLQKFKKKKKKERIRSWRSKSAKVAKT